MMTRTAIRVKMVKALMGAGKSYQDALAIVDAVVPCETEPKEIEPMTFTASQMEHNRYTTRAVTLDLLHDACDEAIQASTRVADMPADGLSISEAARVLSDSARVLRAVRKMLETLTALHSAR